MRRLTDSRFKERLRLLHGSTISAVDMYAGMFVKIGFTCDKGHDFKTTPTSILKTVYGCPACWDAKRSSAHSKSIDLLVSQVRSVQGESIRPVGEYVGNKKKMEWECDKGHRFMATPATILIGSKCQQCIGRLVNNHEQYIVELERRFAGKVRPLERYINSATKISHRCSNGHEFMTSPNYILSSLLGGCAACAGMKKRDNAEYDEKVRAIHDSRVVRIGDYVNNNTPIKHTCDSLHEWIASPASIISQESGCPICADYGFKLNLPASLYYLRVIEKSTCDHYFKIGVTNRDVVLQVKQMEREGCTVEIVKIFWYEVGARSRGITRSICLLIAIF
jgi:hypothetical protein